jgi:chloramphenicol 3-O phosphotransferase
MSTNVGTGTIVFLNGTSSSGKTSVARALRQVLAEPYFYVAADQFSAMLPGQPVDAGPYLALFSAMHRSLAALAAAGANVVVDHVVGNKTWLKECVDLLSGYRVLFVGVLCPPDELERRERERGDRRIGQAGDQLGFVHAHGLYDLEVDTSTATPEDCALRIKRRLEAGPPPTAFRQLRDSVFLNDHAGYGWVLFKGAHGEDVRRLQEDLRRLGYDPGPCDGDFGEQTHVALRAFQTDKGLKPDGATWTRTVKALVEALAAL